MSLLSTGHRGSVLAWPERACPFCNTRDVRALVPAPKGWYRCHACGTATPEHQMFYRTHRILVGPSNAFPTLELVGSVMSDAQTPATLSAGTITAAPGDQLMAQVVARTTGIVDLTVSVTWGNAAVAMLPAADIYSFDGGAGYGQCMRHTVVAHQTAAMDFNFSGTVPEHRAIVVVRVRGVIAPAVEPFDDQDDRNGYPDQLTVATTRTDACLVVFHAQAADLATTPVVWDNQVTQRIRLGSASLVNSVLSNSIPLSLPTTVRMTSGPAAAHGTGWFEFGIQR
jgi:hypothetical protein